MAIDFNATAGKTFGQQTGNHQASADRPKAEFWINLGYTSEVADDEGKAMFVSLPQGIPLDTQEHLKTNSRNNGFAAFQAARNDLLDQLLAHAQTLQPGEDTIVNLQVQVRRVNQEQAPINTERNPFKPVGKLF